MIYIRIYIYTEIERDIYIYTSLYLWAKPTAAAAAAWPTLAFLTKYRDEFEAKIKQSNYKPRVREEAV